MLTSPLMPNYELNEILHEGDDTVIYRATSQIDKQSVILKILKAEYPSLDAITNLKHEYKIIENLNLESVVKVLRLENHENRLALVFEDFGGQSLKQLLSTRKLELSSFMSIAFQMTQALVSVHTHHIIHKDIKPGNIIINPETGVVKLTDFSIASQLNKETPQLANPQQLEGTLAYMSPEQTGRMNRTLDYRSDFYSLGVTFYEMLTGKLPFKSDDPLELIYCHIAKQPVEIEQLNPEVPSAISAIVGKLMAKNAEDRYQTAKGLLADLEICWENLKTTGQITDFTPGRLDVLSQLLIPQKLYGRETQVNLLLESFERVSQGNPELILVSGYSGIGKSSVVNEVNKPITRSKGFFISGKFDQFQRSMPYASLIQAFSVLMRQLLTENITKLEEWRSKILAALGSNGQVIIDVIPEVELIVGKQPKVAELGASDSQNRFNRVFSEFIRVFTKKEHPLVIFLDDLQWADSGTLKLMELLITDLNSKYLLLIGAYRDNEVSSTHPLIHTIEEIQKNNIIVNNIILQPLLLTDASNLVSDALNESPEAIEILTDLLYNKTGGNPFFLIQLLLVLYQEKFLKFNFTTASWQWRIDEIQAIGITNKSVVELVASRIQNLPQATQEILKLAACIGNRFSLDVLSIVSEKSPANSANELYYALQAGLILPLNDAYRIPLLFEQEDSASLTFDSKKVGYKFLHDRVQQAAYSLIPEDKKQVTHLQIGQLILQQTPSESLLENILDIVNQLNFGLDLLTKKSEKDELAKLNLMAGKKAKQATAYETAANYFNIGLALLTADSWQTDYEQTLNLHIETAEAEYLISNFEISTKLANISLEKTKIILDKVRIYEVIIQTLMAQNKMPDVLTLCVDILAQLGIHLPQKPIKLHLIIALIKTKLILIDKQIEDLSLAPEMSDSHKLAAMKIFMFLIPASSQAASLLFPLSILAMVRLSVKYGNSPFAAFSYSTYGSILCDKFGEIDTGYRFGKLSLKLLSLQNTNSIKAKIYFSVDTFIRHYKEHVKETITSLLEGMHSGLENGDIEFGNYCATSISHHLFLSGENLDIVERKICSHIELMQKLKLKSMALCNGIFRQASLNLQGRALDKYVLLGEAFNELTMIEELNNNNSWLSFLYGCKTIIYYLFNDYYAAIKYAKLTAKTHEDNAGLLIYLVNNFYYSLALLANFHNISSSEYNICIKQVTANQKQMKKWANHAPCNFKHKYELVEAEKARVQGKIQVAVDLYDQSIAGAKENGYIQEEALANELAARFYLSLGKEKIAKMYMTEAYYGYIRWGAIAKVQDLDERYPNLIIRHEIVKDTEIDVTRTITTTKINYLDSKSHSNSVLDLATVIKALQAISSEIVLDKLLDTLLRIILENAAAQKGCLILLKGNELFIEAIKTTNNSSVVRQSISVNGSQDIPVAIVNYVARTQEPLVFNDAITEAISQSDPYIQHYQPKSILCAPIFYQGKFIGILYLENNLATGAFTSDRVTILNLITSQAAISLENSRLYQQAQDYAKQLEISLSDLQHMQLQLVQSEKMSTLGGLVSGIAHEINNPIGFITGNLEPATEYVQDLLGLIDLYQQHYPQPIAEITKKIKAIDLDYVRKDLPKLIASMQEGVNRIYDVSVSLRTFSRADTQKPITCNIHEVIDSTIMILKHRLKVSDSRPAIEIVKKYGELPPVQCFPGQLSQVFMNLIANAIDALEDSNMGRSMDEMKANPNCITLITQPSEDQKNIVIQIKDNGQGMTAEVKQKIFDHLFTTKPVGKGTGLGLAICYQIVTEKHGGIIECISSPGEGAEFIIQIPTKVLSPV